MGRLFSALLTLGLLAGCTVNPVTGRSEINLVPLSQQRSIGREQYGPSQQSQGGAYQTDPALSAYVSEVGQRIAAVSDLQLDYEFVVLNNGTPNAWALPGGKIAVNRGLLTELNNEAELAAVLGHEVVHAAAGHGAQAMTRGTLLQGALAGVAIATRDNDYSNEIVGASQVLAQLTTQRYGREAERESDYYGIQYMVRAGYDPQAAVTLQETFVRLSEGRNQNWLEGLFASHPPSEERVMNNRQLVSELQPMMAGRDMELGELRYQQAIGQLKENQVAYELSDEAEQAIRDGDLDIAFGNLNEAINILPQEARFYGLQGDIRLQQKRYEEAVELYDDAIARDDGYFDYYLGRGMAFARLNRRADARRDLEASNSLLSTSVAQNELGKLSLAEGQRQLAKEYFQTAAQAQGQVGREALAALNRLNFEDSPASYIAVQTFADSKGYIHLRVVNRAEYPVAAVQLEVSVRNADRVSRNQVQTGELQGGEVTELWSGLRFADNAPRTAENVAARITGVSL